MSAVVIPFPLAQREASGGVVHVWAREEGGFEIGHESRSGDSWGFFAEYPTPGEAVERAHTLNQDELGGSCEVFVPPHIRALLRKGGK